LAADELIPGKIVLVKTGKLAKFVSKPPPGQTFNLPTGPDDPTVSGGSLRIFDIGTPGAGDALFVLGAGGWSGLGNPPGSKGFKYKGAGAAGDPCKLVLIKEKVIKAVCKGTS
jgi:hypothetical protein